MFHYNKIFAALDGGSTQQAVVHRAINLAESNDAELVFGHVIDSVPYEANGIDFAALCEDGKARIEEALAPEFGYARRNEHIKNCELVVRAGRITDTLAENLIAPFDPDLVICGARGLSNLKYAFVGSVSTYLIRHMNCDVLVVKPETDEERGLEL